MRVSLKEDDFLVFMSDGITAAFGSSADLCAKSPTFSRKRATACMRASAL